MSFFKDLKEDIAQSVNELTESLDENLAVDDEKTKETVTMSELTTDFPPEEPAEEVPELVVENNETEENRYVYITETGEVYHTSRTCYHIKLTIRQIPDGELSDRYQNLSPCERCAEGRTTDGTVYITETGDRSHLSVSCSGLKRTVMRVKQKNVGSIPPCSNCGNG